MIHTFFPGMNIKKVNHEGEGFSLHLGQFSAYKHWTAFIEKRKQVQMGAHLYKPIHFF